MSLVVFSLLELVGSNNVDRSLWTALDLINYTNMSILYIEYCLWAAFE
jgi:hypothetical protein